jgi:hypothetical protein
MTEPPGKVARVFDRFPQGGGTEDEQMFTQIGKQLKVTAQVAALGLLSVAALGARADSTDIVGAPAFIGQMEVIATGIGLADAPAFIGQMEVVATGIRLADGRAVGAHHRSAQDSTALLGAMTVTATRIPTLADESRQPSSGGESPVARERTPRAVLVQ